MSSPLAENALLDAISAWGGADADRLLSRFATPPRRHPQPQPDPLERLRMVRDAQATHDPSRVHLSWSVRALREESESVRRAVINGLDDPLRTTLRDASGLLEADLVPDTPADPGAVARARSLWTERLVGDLPNGPDDLPAIVALTETSPIGLYRLLRLCGFLKLAMVPGDGTREDGPVRVARRDVARSLAPTDPRLLAIADRDATAARSLGRHWLAGLGLITLGRLLAKADPYRVRWALQHVPYDVAKRLRAAASAAEAGVRAVATMERSLLDTAWSRLRDEGRSS